MSKAIKYLLNQFLLLYLLMVSSPQIAFAQFSYSESQNSISPQIIKIEIFDKSNGIWKDQTTTFWQDKTLIFDESSTNLKITLAELDSIIANQFQYSYRLGTTNPWIQLENNTIEIQNILHGKSTLQIRKSDLNNNLSADQIEILVYRQQPFYFRYPFLIGVLLVTISLIIYFRKWAKSIMVNKESNIKDESSSFKTTQSPPPKEKVTKLPVVNSLSKIEESQKKIIAGEWEKLVHKNANLLIDDGKFSIIELAATMNLSERQFRRKLKQKTGLRPADYMREIRLLKAKEFLINQSFSTVVEVCYAVGFSTPKHFSKIFKERFGEKPSFYLGNRKQS